MSRLPTPQIVEEKVVQTWAVWTVQSTNVRGLPITEKWVARIENNKLYEVDRK